MSEIEINYSDFECNGCKRSLDNEDIESIDDDGRDRNISFLCQECGEETLYYENLREE